jgi:chemotaxis protein CheD
MIAPVEIYLHPGEVYAADRASVITTILGSCVSVCLSERGSDIGGLNHFLLPEQRSGGAASTRYAHGAIEALINRVLSFGAQRSRLSAKLFGGANVLHAFQDGVLHIGAANVAMARTLLARYDIPIAAEDVGGTRGRRLVFSSHDGSVSVQRLRT